MTAQVLFSAPPDLWPVYRPYLLRACAAEGIEAAFLDRTDKPEDIDYIAYHPGGGLEDFTPFTRTRAVLSLWAGVERIVGNPTLRMPLCRMVDTGLTRGMVEWVSGHVLRYHLGIDAHLAGQDGVWRNDIVPPLARDRRVGILGLGALGMACTETLGTIGFEVHGWSRRPKSIEGITTHAGDTGLRELLARSEILVTLLPATGQTENVLDARTLAMLPSGARLINPGRGTLIDDTALLSALDSGQLAHATLDVFRTEPLPHDHAFWRHPRVTVTPHIASETRPETASECIAENIRRGETGLPLLHQVDRRQGY